MKMEIQTIDQALQYSGIKICVYSVAGGGKTVLSCTCGAPTIVISNEAGLLSLRNLPEEVKRNVGVIVVHSSTDVGHAYNMLAARRIADWIVIDSASEVCETLLADKKKGAADPRKAYGEMADEFLEMIRMFRDLPGYNVLMTFKQGRVKDDITGVTTYGPLLPGKQADVQVPYLFDEVFALRVENDGAGNMVRILQTGRDISYEGKDRSGSLEMFEIANIAHIAQKIGHAVPSVISEIDPALAAPIQTPAPEPDPGTTEDQQPIEQGA
jgi:hypothetical protein